MSGTGKSSVIEELRSRGFAAIDTDYDDWCEPVILNGDSECVWREDRMRELLTEPLTSPLFVSGCRSNQKRFYAYFDIKVLFSAPLEMVLERVAKRSSNPYGKSEAERAEICRNYEEVQPLLQNCADFEVDSSAVSVHAMADFVAELALNDSRGEPTRRRR